MAAGKSLKNDIDLILRGDIGVNLLITNNVFLGIGLGALMINGKKSEGIIKHLSNMAIYGMGTVGTRF